MERLTAGVGVVVLIVAIVVAVQRADTSETPAAIPPRESPSPEPASTDIAAAPDATDHTPGAGPVRALLASTGVPLVVRQQTDDGYLVATPCASLDEVDGRPIGPFDVVLDAGHGGPADPGAVGANGLTEANINLQVAASASLELAARGIPVLLTRNSNYAITLPMRIELAEAVDAKLLISIHHNAPKVNPSSVPGTEVFVQSGAPESIRLGGLLQDRVVTALSAFDVPWVAARDAGVLQVRNPENEDAYGMVRRPPMPAVLLEMGYLANPPEADLYASTAYLEVAGLAIADAVEAWLRTEEFGAPLRAAGRIRDPAASAATNNCVDPPLE